ncbi:MAG: Nif3-like dinuclear metal center hexameric protein [Paludibacteraceae bacterium]|nr:Nif3-like dinuclear metal center hexameric protein [Paludibacteraceae bacterium]
MILQDIINIIESVAPLSYQEAWDNSGLQVGDRNAEVHEALLTVDVTESVVNEAISIGCDLIISHHPLIFRGLKQLTGATPQERCVMQALRHNIAIYSAHTSMDSYLHGVSGRIAEKLGICDYRILIPSVSHAEAGLGVIGDLPQSMDNEEFVAFVARVFATPNTSLRWVEGSRKQVRKVAICGGAGAEFVEQAIAQGADAFVSADFKYHELQNAYQRITVVDMDHWVSEHFTREIFEQLLSPYISTRIARADMSPVKYHLPLT